jgi:hypothetical protein
VAKFLTGLASESQLPSCPLEAQMQPPAASCRNPGLGPPQLPHELELREPHQTLSGLVTVCLPTLLPGRVSGVEAAKNPLKSDWPVSWRLPWETIKELLDFLHGPKELRVAGKAPVCFTASAMFAC